jgi:hypothetical protein
MLICLVVIINIGFLIVSGCDIPSPPNSTAVAGVYTFDNDGHKFIVSAGDGMLHHPACQCFKDKLEK